MIKKIILILFLLASIIACGKKGDPEYKAKISNFINTKIYLVSWDIKKKIFSLKKLKQVYWLKNILPHFTVIRIENWMKISIPLKGHLNQ